MPRTNQVSIDQESDEYICHTCDDRPFTFHHNLLQHVRTASTHHGEWCERCAWLFVSADARTAHVKNSLSHWVCSVCKIDETSRNGLAKHYAQEHLYCFDCAISFNEYREHRIQSHRRCRECDGEFGDDNQLAMHRQVHIPRNKECYACAAKFPNDSAILIHLESGACCCGVTETHVNNWAVECYQSRRYTVDTADGYYYCCPVCDSGFNHVSSLLQHIESPACSASYTGAIAKLRKYLMERVAEFSIPTDYDSPYYYSSDGW